jgi:hypothetical protein
MPFQKLCRGVMSESHFAGKLAAAVKARTAAPVPPPTPAPRIRARRAPDSRRTQIMVLVGLVAVGGIVVAALATQVRTPEPASSLPTATTSTVRATYAKGEDHRTGKIVLDQPDSNGCRQRVFDNKSGGVLATDGPCAAAGSDGSANSARGTTQRLDAINKSFSNR